MNGIGIAVFIFIILGLIAAFILWLANRYLSTPTDETVAKLREHLPGINCGACGFAGCDDYAVRLAAGGVACTRCIPGGADVAKALGEVLGVTPDDVAEQRAFIACCGTTEARDGLMVYDGIPTCQGSNMFFSGKGKCDFACLGYGDCKAVCPFGAIEIIDGRAQVDREICTGCGVCVSHCPNELIHLLPKKSAVVVGCSSPRHGSLTRQDCKNGCIGCGKCQRICPADAVRVENWLARIDPVKCIGCGACQKECPVGCIVLLENKK